jgi:hypothetical protein
VVRGFRAPSYPHREALSIVSSTTELQARQKSRSFAVTTSMATRWNLSGCRARRSHSAATSRRASSKLRSSRAGRRHSDDRAARRIRADFLPPSVDVAFLAQAAAGHGRSRTQVRRLHDLFVPAVTAAGPGGVAAFRASRTCNDSKATESLSCDVNDLGHVPPAGIAGNGRAARSTVLIVAALHLRKRVPARHFRSLGDELSDAPLSAPDRQKFGKVVQGSRALAGRCLLKFKNLAALAVHVGQSSWNPI